MLSEAASGASEAAGSLSASAVSEAAGAPATAAASEAAGASADAKAVAGPAARLRTSASAIVIEIFLLMFYTLLNKMLLFTI